MNLIKNFQQENQRSDNLSRHISKGKISNRMKKIRLVALVLFTVNTAFFLIGTSSCSLFLHNYKQNKTTADVRLSQSLAHYEQGLKFEQEGKQEEAIAEFKKTNELSSRPAAYYHLGLLYAAQEKYPLAVSQFEKAIELVPTYDAARKELDRIRGIQK